MDASRFDRLARSLTEAGTRRGLLRLIAALPLLGGLADLLASDGTDAAGRRMRRKKRHKHGKGRHKGQRKNKKQKKPCRPKSRTRTCVGRCGVVRNRCGQRVDCGSCACDPPCLEGCCGEDGTCQPGANDSACGTSGVCVDCGNGRRCLAGECTCDSTSCSEGCCDGDGQCLPDSDFACGTGGAACARPCLDDGTDVGHGPEESALLMLLNNHRVNNGLLALAHNAQLATAAEAHSLDMATRGYFAHVSPDGADVRDRVSSQGYNADLLGENLAGGFLTGQGVFDAWQASTGDNANMLRGGFFKVGIGRAFKPDSQHHWYWTAVFASPDQE